MLNLQRLLRLILINAVRQFIQEYSYRFRSGTGFIYSIQKDQTSYWPLSKRWLVPMRLQSHNKFYRHSKLVSSQVIPHRVWKSPVRNINRLSIQIDEFLGNTPVFVDDRVFTYRCYAISVTGIFASFALA